MPRGEPTPSSAAASTRMRSNRRSNTRPEIALRSALHRLGLRFRKDYPIRIRARTLRPDIVFIGHGLAVYVDGCFWHQCPTHGTLPRANSVYWQEKLMRNVARDREMDRELTAAGWRVVRVWEHEDPGEVASSIRAFLADASEKPELPHPNAPGE